MRLSSSSGRVVGTRHKCMAYCTGSTCTNVNNMLAMADTAIGATGLSQCHLNRPKTHNHGCTASSGLVADKH